MRHKHPLRHRFLTFLRDHFNPITRKMARSKHGPFALILHTGRRSGKLYETPIIVRPIEGGFVLELTYGPNVDWYQNVIAAGGCTVVWHGKRYVIDHVELIDATAGRAAFPLAMRLILRAAGLKHFVKMAIQR